MTTTRPRTTERERKPLRLAVCGHCGQLATLGEKCGWCGAKTKRAKPETEGDDGNGNDEHAGE